MKITEKDFKLDKDIEDKIKYGIVETPILDTIVEILCYVVIIVILLVCW